MPAAHLGQQTAEEYFRDLVDSALLRQHLRATELTEYYLVNLLCRFIKPSSRIPFSDDSSEPLALRLRRALESGGHEQRERLRNLGDFSLFTSGFFGDSLLGRVVDIDYYVSMGEYAYGSLSRRDEEAFGEVFSELARKFVGFMDVLTDVSEHTSLISNADLLRIYDRWVRTGSRREGHRLLERGILPPSGSKRVQ